MDVQYSDDLTQLPPLIAHKSASSETIHTFQRASYFAEVNLKRMLHRWRFGRSREMSHLRAPKSLLEIRTILHTGHDRQILSSGNILQQMLKRQPYPPQIILTASAPQIPMRLVFGLSTCHLRNPSTFQSSSTVLLRSLAWIFIHDSHTWGGGLLQPKIVSSVRGGSPSCRYSP